MVVASICSRTFCKYSEIFFQGLKGLVEGTALCGPCHDHVMTRLLFLLWNMTDTEAHGHSGDQCASSGSCAVSRADCGCHACGSGPVLAISCSNAFVGLGS